MFLKSHLFCPECKKKCRTGKNKTVYFACVHKKCAAPVKISSLFCPRAQEKCRDGKNKTVYSAHEHKKSVVMVKIKRSILPVCTRNVSHR